MPPAPETVLEMKKGLPYTAHEIGPIKSG